MSLSYTMNPPPGEKENRLTEVPFSLHLSLSLGFRLQLRVWSREEVIVNTTYAFEDAEKQFLFLEEYSGFHYPLPKLGE